MIGASALLAFALNLQIQQQAPAAAATPGGTSTSYTVAMPTDTGATAVRANISPVIDGKDDDQVWRIAPPLTVKPDEIDRALAIIDQALGDCVGEWKRKTAS